MRVTNWIRPSVSLGLGMTLAALAGCAAAPPATAQDASTAQLRLEQVTLPGGGNPADVVLHQDSGTTRSHVVKDQTIAAPPIRTFVNVALEVPDNDRDSIITVKVTGASALTATMKFNGTTATATSGMGRATPSLLRNHNNQLVFEPAGELYRQDLKLARAAAIAGAIRPQHFVVSDFVTGDGPDAGALEDSLSMFQLLGDNTLQVSNFGELSSQVAAPAADHGFNQFAWSLAYPPSLYSWSDEAQNPQSWADAKTRDGEQRHPPAKSGLVQDSRRTDGLLPGGHGPSVEK